MTKAKIMQLLLLFTLSIHLPQVATRQSLLNVQDILNQVGVNQEDS